MKKIFSLIALVAFFGSVSFAQSTTVDNKPKEQTEIKKCCKDGNSKCDKGSTGETKTEKTDKTEKNCDKSKGCCNKGTTSEGSGCCKKGNAANTEEKKEGGCDKDKKKE
ncbi:MAG: hypothetical protein ACKOZY_06375 [Flavobacteriales bacterium]